jgi:D-3-phosphoglycerate dehydrogenase
MSSVHVLYLGPEYLIDDVRRELPGMQVSFGPDRDAVENMIADVDVVFDASMAIRFDTPLLERARRLNYYVTATTGSNHIDVDVLAARGIPLRTLRDEPDAVRNITAAAEHSWLLLMACARQLRPAIDHVLQGSWDRTQFPGLMLKGRTLGIIGCGRIGRWMATYGTAFGMRCIGYDPAPTLLPDNITPASLDDVLQSADAVTVHVPMAPETIGLLGARELSLLKPGAILVNTSRGEIIDEAALLEALENGRIGALGVDVLFGEPATAESKLLAYARAHDNVVITPHIGGFSPDALRFVIRLMCGRIRERMVPVSA